MKTTPSTPFLECFRRCTGVFSLPVVAVTACCLALSPQQGLALPIGGQLVAGQVTATVHGTQLTLDQASRAAIMNWSQFNVAPNELVRILQSSPDAAMLARVTGGDPSQLLGRIQADGKLFLINPKGIVVGQGAVIDTAAFLASTLDVADADFLKGGPLTFQGDSTAGVVNLGKITAREGNVLLLAHTVQNTGEISAAHGTAGLGSGTEVYLASPDAPVFVIKTSLAATTEKTGVDHSGVITAAQAQLEAAGGSMFDLAINHSGRVQATGVEHRPDGRIILTAGGGNVLVSGAATARAADGSGGEILVGGDYQGKNATVANATNTQVTASATLDASASSATDGGGRIIIWSDNATRFDGVLSARAGMQGGAGGFAEVSGKHSLGFAGAVDLAAPAGTRGRLLLDPDDITIIPGSVAAPAGLADRIWLSSEDGASQVLGADTLTGLLATADVFMQAGNKLQVDAPVIVAAGGASGVQLSLQAPTVTLNETVSLANVVNGRIQILTGSGTLSSASGATLAASKIYIGGLPNVTLNGPVSTSELVYNSLGAPASFTATNPANAVAKFTLNTDEADPQEVTFSGNVGVHSSTAMHVDAMIGGANNVTFASAGDLTVLGTTAISGSGTTKLASTGGVLINQAGASFLAGTARRVLYTSAMTGAFSLGGLTGYTQVDNIAFPDDPNGAARVLYNSLGASSSASVTITANDFIKLYGQPDPVFTASYAGGTAANLLMLPSFSIQQGAHVNVGTYTIVPAGATSGTHVLHYVNGTLRIDPATLTYVANAASRFYGDANPAFGGTVTGFVNGDTLASATTGTLAFTSPASAASNAGSAAINGGGLTANHGNYVFQDASANFSALTVNKAPLTVTFADATRTYGAANPTFVPTFSGLRNGDTGAALAGYSWGSFATANSPVGTYEITASGTSDVQNYAVTTVPGRFTITPAPLTLTVNAAAMTYGDAMPAFSYALAGLENGDTSAVLSGVQFNTILTSASGPGTYDIRPTILGTAQNYQVTTVVPGALTIRPKPITVTVNDLSMYASLGLWISPTTSSSAGPAAGGPEFAVGVALTRTTFDSNGVPTTTLVPVSDDLPAGSYRVTPVIYPGPLTTLAEVERFYDFTLNSGTLTLVPPPLADLARGVPYDQWIREQGTLIVGNSETLVDNSKDIQDKLKQAIKESEEASKVVVGGGPVSALGLAETAADFGDDLLAYIPGVLESIAKGAMEGGSSGITHVLRDLQSGALTMKELIELSQSNSEARSALMPLLAKAMMDKLNSGAELTPHQSVFVQRMAQNVEIQRQLLKKELIKQKKEFEEEKFSAGLNNQYSFKTMPDIAITAQQAATEQAIAAAIGAGVGLGVGTTTAAILNVTAVAGTILPFAAKTVVALEATTAGLAASTSGLTKTVTASATGLGAGTVGGVVLVAVGAIVVGVVAGVQLEQENRNVAAYNAAMTRANTPVEKDLSNLNLKDDKTAQAEFFAAFMATTFEAGFNAPRQN